MIKTRLRISAFSLLFLCLFSVSLQASTTTTLKALYRELKLYQLSNPSLTSFQRRALISSAKSAIKSAKPLVTLDCSLKSAASFLDAIEVEAVDLYTGYRIICYLPKSKYSSLFSSLPVRSNIIVRATVSSVSTNWHNTKVSYFRLTSASVSLPQ